MKKIRIESIEWSRVIDDSQEPGIDADLWIDADPVSVTLLPPEDGRATPEWTTWGADLAYWCSDPSVFDDEEGETDRNLADEVVCRVSDEAVRRGFTREASSPT